MNSACSIACLYSNLLTTLIFSCNFNRLLTFTIERLALEMNRIYNISCREINKQKKPRYTSFYFWGGGGRVSLQFILILLHYFKYIEIDKGTSVD